MEKKKGWWGRKTNGQRVSFIFAVILAALCLFIIVVAMDLRRFASKEIADSFYGESVSNGWELLWGRMVSSSISWLASIIIVAITIFVIFISNFITHLFDNKSRKAKTISSLIRSLVKYGTIILAVCGILITWGVDVVGIIAGVGVLTLIIGLGCQSLIQDVVSGLFVVFDDYFAVGDTVIIDGFRGTITEVGLKTTKIEDYGGNIKSITNSSITTVVNMSRLRSVASVTLSVSYNEDVERVEGLILEEIENLKTKVPNIIEGPFYKGIDSIGASSINFLVHAFTLETNRYQVTRDLNREFYLLFKKHDIQIPYNQITVNSSDDKNRKKATPEEIALSVKSQKELRGLEDNKEDSKKSKKARVAKELKTALSRAQKDME